MFVTRLISGIVLVAVALLTICSGGWILYGTLTIVSLIGMFELYRAVKVQKQGENLLAVVGYLGVILHYILLSLGYSEYAMMNLIIVLIAMMFVYVFSYPKYHAEQVMAAFFGVVYVGVMLSYIYQTRMIRDGAFLVWLIFLCSWGCDTCAYCVGMLIGKHKMTPKLSPTQVVLAHLPHRCSPSSGDHLPLLFVTGYSRMSFGIFQRACSASCSGRKRGRYPLTLLGDENHSCTKFFRFPISFLICEVC